MLDTHKNTRAIRITLLGLWFNIALAVIKIVAGSAGMSIAVVADGIHTLSDTISDIVAIMGLKISQKPQDDSHHYGHGKFETLAAAIIGLLIFAAGMGIGYTSVMKFSAILSGKDVESPRLIVLSAVLLSIIIKEWMYRLTSFYGKKLKSQVLIANAWHHRTDVLSSLAVFIGIGSIFLLGDSFYILDPLSAIIVSLFVIKVSVNIVLNAINELLEKSIPADDIEKIRMAVLSADGVIGMHKLKTRKIGNNIAVELHILVDKDLNIVHAHNIASDVERKIRSDFGPDTFITVHTEPYFRDDRDAYNLRNN